MTSIMIVDDDDLLTKTIEIALEKEDYEVTSILSGEECLKRLKTSRPDLILLDIMMPDMDGWTTLKEIKADESLAAIPVIMLTAKVQTNNIRAKKGELGFTDYLTKPFDIDDLYFRLSKALQPPNKT